MSESKPQENSLERLYTSWEIIEDLVTCLERNTRLAGEFHMIVAIGRGGWIPAVMLSHRLKIRTVIPIVAVGWGGSEESEESRTFRHPDTELSFMRPIYRLMHQAGVLVVDDICDTGETFKKLRRFLPLARFVTLMNKPEGGDHCNYSVRAVPQSSWVVFPWEA